MTPQTTPTARANGINTPGLLPDPTTILGHPARRITINIPGYPEPPADPNPLELGFFALDPSSGLPIAPPGGNVWDFPNYASPPFILQAGEQDPAQAEAVAEYFAEFQAAQFFLAVNDWQRTAKGTYQLAIVNLLHIAVQQRYQAGIDHVCQGVANELGKPTQFQGKVYQPGK